MKGYRTGYVLDARPTGGFERLEGVAEGAYLVAAEVGLWSDPALVLAEADALVRAGETTEVELTLDEHALGPPPVPFRGTLHLAGGATDLPLSLLVKRVGGPRLRAGDRVHLAGDDLVPQGDGRTFAWDAGLVSPGDYLIRVDPLQLAAFFLVGPDGEVQARVEVPALAEVEVRVVERPSGEVLPLDEIHWSRGTPRRAGSWSLEKVELEPGEDTFRFVAPLGLLGISANSEVHSGGAAWVQVKPGTNAFEVDMTRLETIRIDFRDGEIRVPWDWSMRVQVERLDGEGEGRAAAEERGVLTVTVPEPGDWRISFSAIDGFEPIEPVEVRVEGGVATRRTIELRRVE